MLAVRRIFVDPRIAVAVGDIDVAVRRQSRVGATVERQSAHRRRGPARNAEGEHDPTFRASLSDRMVAVIGAAEHVVAPDVNAMRIRKGLRPRSAEISLPIEYDHRVLAAID